MSHAADEPPNPPETVERLRPRERALVEDRPGVPWTHPLRESRMGDPWKGTGFLRRLRCRFCLSLDGTDSSSDEGRIGYTNETQFTEHMEREHQL